MIKEIENQEKDILKVAEKLAILEGEGLYEAMRVVQDLAAVNRHMISRIDALIKPNMKDAEILRILQECEKESDGYRQKCRHLEEDNERLRAKLHHGGPRLKNFKSEGQANEFGEVKFGIDDEDKTISDIDLHDEVNSI